MIGRQSIRSSRCCFSAASDGAAYSHGEFGAYGRLLAWRSLAGLVGLDAETPLSDISERASDCRWTLFDAANDWFWQIIWDFGIACLSPDGCELAILAASDTD